MVSPIFIIIFAAQWRGEIRLAFDAANTAGSEHGGVRNLCAMDTKAFRQRLRERSDIKFVFLANENNPESKDYQDFVRTNLDGEHNITIDDNRFRQMQDLFGFNAIPFYVTLIPDGRIVQDGLLLRGGEAGYDLFIEVLEDMKARLE